MRGGGAEGGVRGRERGGVEVGVDGAAAISTNQRRS